jgi:transcriptional antiterminator RfaH
MAQWHAVHTRAGTEGKALIGIEKAGMAAYLPVEIVFKTLRRERWRTWRPLFPRYLFAELDPGRDLPRLAEIEGATGVLRVAGQLSPIDHAVIDAIKRAEALGMFDVPRNTRLACGDLVRLPHGPLGGLMAKIKSARPGRRLELLGDFPFRVTATVDKLEKIRA